jgi:hypothetical protein
MENPFARPEIIYLNPNDLTEHDQELIQWALENDEVHDGGKIFVYRLLNRIRYQAWELLPVAKFEQERSDLY